MTEVRPKKSVRISGRPTLVACKKVKSVMSKIIGKTLKILILGRLLENFNRRSENIIKQKKPISKEINLCSSIEMPNTLKQIERRGM